MPFYMPKMKVRYWSITKILTVKEYWNLIGREPFLARTWEPDFSQVCSFCKMLMNHNNFHFTQIPDKTNVSFSKSSKTMFLGHIWLFLVIFAWWGFFPKDPALSHTTIYGPLNHAKFQKKLMNLSRENLQTDGRMDGKMNGQTLFYRTLPAKAKGPIRPAYVTLQ